LNGAAVPGTFAPFYLGVESERLNTWRRRIAQGHGRNDREFTTLIRRVERLNRSSGYRELYTEDRNGCP
jgi:hypothetical protein